MHDMDGWPLVAGARVRVEYPTLLVRRHVAACKRTGECPCPAYPAVRHGAVRRVVEATEVQRAYVEVVEFESFNVLTPAPSNVRVMRGRTAASRRHALLTSEGARAYRRRGR